MRFLLLVFLLISNGLFSQTILTGTILDSVKFEPIEYASIRLFSSLDSSVVQGIYSDEKGKFTMDVNPGTYFVKISFSGYTTKEIKDLTISKNQPSFDLGKIGLSIASQDIKEVTVTADVDILKAGIDKKVYNVDQDLSVKGGTADDVLNNIPSVEVDQDGNIALRGDGNVTILIDGRPSSLVSGDGNFLDAIPASSIERIEVVTNPSAKYDPDGTSGIINIVLKKNKLKGVNGMLTATGGTGHDHSAAASLSYRTAKFNVYGSYAFDYYKGYRNNFSVIEQYYNDSTARLNQDREGTDFRYGHAGQLGFDWYINNSTVLAIGGGVNSGFRERTGDQFNKRYANDSLLLDEWNRVTRDPNESFNYDVRISLDKTLKEEKGKWSLGATNSNGQRASEGHYNQVFLIEDQNNATTPSLYQLQGSDRMNNVFTTQFDFEYILKKINARIETGAKGIIRSEDLHAFSKEYNYSTDSFEPDSLTNYDYTYDEQIISSYFVFGQQLGKFKYQIGVRPEYAIQEPRLVGSENDYRKTYLNAFPSGHVRYSLSKSQEISLSYSRRINRPSSWNLNPFTSYADPYNLRMGNPDLNPEYINSYDLGHSFESKKFTLNSSVFYRQTTGVMQRIKRFYENNTSAVTWENTGTSQSGGIELVAMIKPTKWWKNTLSWNGNFIEYRADDPALFWNNSGLNWSLKYTGKFDFWKNTASIQLNGRYSAPRITVQGKVEPWTYFDVSAEKMFLDKKLVIGVRFADVFNTKGFKYTVDLPDVYQHSEFKWLTRRAYLTLTYKFGKLDIGKGNSMGGGGGGFDF